MKNDKLKENLNNALDDELLDNVTGGVNAPFGDQTDKVRIKYPAAGSDELNSMPNPHAAVETGMPSPHSAIEESVPNPHSAVEESLIPPHGRVL